MASRSRASRSSRRSRHGRVGSRYLLLELPLLPTVSDVRVRAEAQRQALSRLRDLSDPSDRPLVAWAAPELTRDTADLLDEHQDLTAAGVEVPDLTRYLRVRLNLPFEATDLLDAWGPGVPTAHVLPEPPGRGGNPHATKELARMPGEVSWQPNLGPRPGGMAVFDSAWWPHKAGLGVKVAFVARGYQRAHPDYRHLQVRELHTPDPHQPGPGTWALGVLFAQPIHEGLVGIVPRASAVFSRPDTPRTGEGPVLSMADAVDRAATALDPGDVLLVALAPDDLPVEHDPATFAAIQLATARGIHVVEAAGDGETDLDDPSHAGRYDLALRDSGAILVTGYLRQPQPPPPAPTRIRGSRGQRVDAHAPSPIYTTKPAGPHRHLVQWFEGSASASTQVAGVVALASSAVQQRRGEPVHPARMREALRVTGTEARIDADRPLCGTQPNLEELLEVLLEPTAG